MLEQVHEIPGGFDAKTNNVTHLEASSITDTMVFPHSQIIRCACADVDLHYASKGDKIIVLSQNGDRFATLLGFLPHHADGFQTDSQISHSHGTPRPGQNGEVPQMRELEQWVPEEGEEEHVDLTLDLGHENGWNPEDMFKHNEDKYGVQSTYNPNLEGYTLQLKERNSEEYRYGRIK